MVSRDALDPPGQVLLPAAVGRRLPACCCRQRVAASCCVLLLRRDCCCGVTSAAALLPRLSTGMQKRQTNSTRYEFRSRKLFWKVEWRFPAAAGSSSTQPTPPAAAAGQGSQQPPHQRGSRWWMGAWMKPHCSVRCCSGTWNTGRGAAAGDWRCSRCRQAAAVHSWCHCSGRSPARCVQGRRMAMHPSGLCWSRRVTCHIVF